MVNPTHISKPEFDQKFAAAWAELEACLASLSEKQMMEIRDEQGWNVRDHLTHLAAWEESMARLFQGQPRHQTLGVELDKFSGENIDKINAAIQERGMGMSMGEALEKLRSTHQLLMKSVAGLSETDLNQPAAVFFAQFPLDDTRRVFELIKANASDHYLEHLPWIRKIVQSNS